MDAKLLFKQGRGRSSQLPGRHLVNNDFQSQIANIYGTTWKQIINIKKLTGEQWTKMTLECVTEIFMWPYFMTNRKLLVRLHNILSGCWWVTSESKIMFTVQFRFLGLGLAPISDKNYPASCSLFQPNFIGNSCCTSLLLLTFYFTFPLDCFIIPLRTFTLFLFLFNKLL